MENEGVVYVQEDAASFLRLQVGTKTVRSRVFWRDSAGSPHFPSSRQALLGEFGEIRSFVREEDSWTAIEFFDTRAADACHPALMRVGLRVSVVLARKRQSLE